MERLLIEEVLLNIVAKILEVEPKKLKPNTHFVNDLGVDSVTALEILAAIEKHYKIQIPEEFLPKMVTLGEVVRITKQFI